MHDQLEPWFDVAQVRLTVGAAATSELIQSLEDNLHQAVPELGIGVTAEAKKQVMQRRFRRLAGAPELFRALESRYQEHPERLRRVLDERSRPLKIVLMTSRYTTVVIGPRAYESSEALRAHNAVLLDFVKRGGTLVVQYGQYEMQTPGLMPFPITLSRPADRVTDENSPVTTIDAGSKLLTWPNAIGAADYAGWVQDRSLYMPHTHDPSYAAPISTSDPGEPPNDGGILVAKYGQGTYVYTTLAFFRQLPAGVPGAARLFVNVLSAGSEAPPAATP